MAKKEGVVKYRYFPTPGPFFNGGHKQGSLVQILQTPVVTMNVPLVSVVQPLMLSHELIEKHLMVLVDI